VGTGILPVLYGQAIPPSADLSHQAMAKLGMSSGDLNRTELLATAIFLSTGLTYYQGPFGGPMRFPLVTASYSD